MPVAIYGRDLVADLLKRGHGRVESSGASRPWERNEKSTYFAHK